MKLILVTRLNFSIRYNDVITQTNHGISEIVDMSMGKIQRFQNPLQQGTISLEDAIKVSSTLNISLEEMCGIEHVKFEPRQTRALRDYLTKQVSEKARYFRAIEKDQAQEREILSYLDGILSNTNPV